MKKLKMFSLLLVLFAFTSMQSTNGLVEANLNEIESEINMATQPDRLAIVNLEGRVILINRTSVYAPGSVLSVAVKTANDGKLFSGDIRINFRIHKIDGGSAGQSEFLGSTLVSLIRPGAAKYAEANLQLPRSLDSGKYFIVAEASTEDEHTHIEQAIAMNKILINGLEIRR